MNTLNIIFIVCYPLKSRLIASQASLTYFLIRASMTHTNMYKPKRIQDIRPL